MARGILSLTGFQGMSLLRQSEAAECGLACLGMIASYYGFRSDLSTLRAKYPISMKGCTLEDIISIANDMNLGCRAVRCEPEELKLLRLPAILHWDMKHFVVLKKITKRSAIILDPAQGEVRVATKDLNRHFTGVALEMSPSSGFKRKNERQPVKLSSIVKLAGSSWKVLGQAFALTAFLQIFMLLTPYYMQIVIDEAIFKSDENLLFAIAVAFLLLKLFEVVSIVLRGLASQYLSQILSFDMQVGLFHHMARLPLDYFHKRHVGDIQQRFLSLDPIREFVVNGAITCILDGVFAIFIVIVLYLYSPFLANIVLAVIAFYVVLRLLFLELSKRLSGNLLVAEAKENTKFLESLRAIQTIKIAGIEAENEALYRNLSANTLNAYFRLGNVNIAYDAISQALLGISTIMVVYLAATSTINGAMSIGMITAFMAYKGQLEQRLISLVAQFVEFKLLDVHLERISDIALTKPETGLTVAPMRRRFRGEIELRSVHFKYAPHEPAVLSGVNLKISAGEFVAITGDSGGGKSTLLRLMLGLYEPTSGQVLFDGLPSSAWGLAELRRNFGVVMQDDQLLAGSIAENIAMFAPKPDFGRIQDAAKSAVVFDEVEQMPMNFRSLVGDMGSSLSGGQQQRIMLARALYKDPSLLVLDEITGQLDPENEIRVLENLKALEATKVIVTHRPTTAKMADKIYRLSGGRLTKVIRETQRKEHLAEIRKLKDKAFDPSS